MKRSRYERNIFGAINMLEDELNDLMDDSETQNHYTQDDEDCCQQDTSWGGPFQAENTEAAQPLFEQTESVTEEDDDHSSSNMLLESDIWEQKLSSHLPFSLYETYTMILFFVLKNNIARSEVESLLNFIRAFLPSDNTLVNTKHLFFKMFQGHTPMKRIYFCREHHIVSGSPPCGGNCQLESFLWSFPIKQFVRRLKNDTKFYNLAQSYRLNRSRINGSGYSDVYDGLVYKSIAKPITSSMGGYSFVLNYDGASRWKSSKTSAIPIYMICNEIPFHDRFKLENVLFCGVWLGKNKPEANILFSMLVEELLEADKGIPSFTPYGTPVKVRVRCINSCCDLPAKAALFYQQQHGGKGSCGFCNHSGCKIGTRFCYPLVQAIKGNRFDHSLRTEQQVKEVYKAYDQWRKREKTKLFPIQRGLKGKSVFAKLPYWQWTLFGSIDIMHLMMGVFSILMKLWTRPDYNNGRTRVESKKMKEFDALMCSQAIPSLFHRNIRSIDEHKYWKASECMVFLLYTSRLASKLFPTDKPYYEHHMLLVNSLNALLRGQIDESTLVQVGTQLDRYVIQFQQLYGCQYVTLNVHLLTHLVHSVRLHGPLIYYSAYPFEGYNRVLMNSISGTNQVERGICEAIPMYQHLQDRLRYLGPEASTLLTKIDKGRKLPKDRKIHGVTLLGKKQGDKYKGLRIGKLYIEAYRPKKRKTDDSIVKLKDHRIARVLGINLDKENVVVVIAPLVKNQFVGEEQIQPKDVGSTVMALRDGNQNLLYLVDIHDCHSILLR